MSSALFETIAVPANRALVVDAGFLGAQRHTIFALVEADITQAKAIIQSLGNENKMSLTAYFGACLAKAIEADPMVQAYKNGNKLTVFHDVDLVTMIEPSQGAVAIPHIIREANRKSPRSISDEIRAVQSRPPSSHQASGRLVKLAPKLPRWARLWFIRLMRRNPHKLREMQGTAMLTPVGMFGKGHAGWGITFLPMHTIGVTVGGIQTKPAVIEGAIVPREFVCLTIAADHDIVDGAPVARFAKRFIDLIESAELLTNDQERAAEK